MFPIFYDQIDKQVDRQNTDELCWEQEKRWGNVPLRRRIRHIELASLPDDANTFLATAIYYLLSTLPNITSFSILDIDT